MTAVAERYSRAISSSHLECKRWFEPGGDLDVVIAAGSIKESLGTGLLRLRAEFDSISADPGARSMMPRLKSASAVRLRLVALIQDRGCPPAECIDMAAKLMDQWCDPSCPACTGRGSIGAYGEPQNICNACGGSKRRTLLWPALQQDFADRIAAEMESKVDKAARRIRALLRQD